MNTKEWLSWVRDGESVNTVSTGELVEAMQLVCILNLEVVPQTYPSVKTHYYVYINTYTCVHARARTYTHAHAGHQLKLIGLSEWVWFGSRQETK